MLKSRVPIITTSTEKSCNMFEKYKYILIFVLPLTVSISFLAGGIVTFFPLLVFFILVPLLELFLKPNYSEISEEKRGEASQDPFYSIVIYLMLPVQVGFLIWYLILMSNDQNLLEFIGMSISMGLMCGVIGINVGHELGHRMNRTERSIGVLLLLSSFDTHFKPYHNRGHHYDVGTRQDPASARLNESIYIFWFRSHFGSYVKAWKIESSRMKIMNRKFYSFQNNMMVYTFLQLLLLGVIYFFLDLQGLYSYVLVSVIGIILLETVNYIEHYGLTRNRNEEGKYEMVKLHHSWNSNHILGRILLFELSRHSDHHSKPDRPYQLLKSNKQAPQMPTGYPGMLLLTLIPPLFFRKVNPIIEKI